MKATTKLLTLILLALPVGMLAQGYQGYIDDAYDEILNNKGVLHSTTQDILRDGNGGTEEKNVIHEFKIGKANFKLLDKLQEAFQIDAADASTFYTCFNPLRHDDNRKPWAVSMKRGSYSVGAKPNSSYAIATFKDDARQGFRSVYAVEWWDSADADIKEGVMLFSYGQSPDNRVRLSPSNFNFADSILQTPLSIADSILQRFKLPDADGLLKRFKNGSIYYDQMGPVAIPVDFTKNADEWMSKAMSNIKHLCNSDWHRLFGLLTQKMMDRAARESKEDMVVAAGVVLDLAKHADELDEEEKELSAKRLYDMAEVLEKNNVDDYVCNMILLSAKKLQKE